MVSQDHESPFDSSTFRIPPLENNTLRQRLLQGVAGGNAARGSLSKCANKYKDFLLKYQAGESADTIEGLKQDIMREFELHQLEMRKMMLAVNVAEIDSEQIDSEISSIKAKIQTTKVEIERLRKDYPEAKRIRRNLEEFETIAKKANQRPARYDLEKSISEVKNRLAEVEEEAQKNRDEKALREKQFHLFMQSLFDLKESLAEDDVTDMQVSQDEEDDDGEVKPMNLT